MIAGAVLVATYGPAGPGRYLDGLGMLLHHGEVGHPSYAFGHYGRAGWWWYFPAAWAVKTPIPILVASLGGGALLVVAWKRGGVPAALLILAPMAVAAIAIGSSMRLLVGPNLELAARQLTVSVQATQTANANVYAGFVQPLVEPLIPANRWYLFSDPAASPVYVYGYLNGAEGPQVTTGPVSGVDGVEVSVIFDFGVGAIDWRGAWFNPGT